MAEAKHYQLRGALRVREWRLKSSPQLTQAEMGQRVGVDLPRYNAYENGRARPGLEHAIAIESITGGAVQIQSWAETVSDVEWKRECKRLADLQERVRAA